MDMNTAKNIAVDAVEEKKETVYRLADEIWSHPELSLKEFNSCNLYVETLKKEGFNVEKGLLGIETAFKASFGSGRPNIAILAEYDALSGLSQKKGSVKKEPRDNGDTESDCGHGCGHNLLGAGAFAAALGVKTFLEKAGVSGTVTLYGCPGEEGVASKAFFARDGLWQETDAALTWHPDDCNEVFTGSSNACIQIKYDFKGLAAHASGNPDMGRSALDAAELMNIGVQFLREHMSTKARVHYSILDAGGMSPNVVQDRASLLYMIRSDKVRDAKALKVRVDKIAEGAALMTETTVTSEFVDGLSELVPNSTLEKLLYRNFKMLGVHQFTDEEREFAKKLKATYDDGGRVPGLGSSHSQEYADEVRERMGESALNDFLLPHHDMATFEPGSTDVGDVSWNTPTAQIHAAAWPYCCAGHSWQSTSSAGTSIGKKAALHAGKVLAASAVELILDSGELEKAKEEFNKRTAEGYDCPVPKGAIAKAVI